MVNYLKMQEDKFKTGIGGIIGSLIFVVSTVLMPLGRIFGGFLTYSKTTQTSEGTITNSINYYWDIIKVSHPEVSVPDLNYLDYIDQVDLTAEIIWRLIPLWGLLWIILGIIGAVLVVIPAVQKILGQEPSKIWKIGVIVGLIGTMIEYGLFIAAIFLEDWEEGATLSINIFLLGFFLVGWIAIIIGGMFIGDDELFNRMKEHSELIIGLCLAVPILLLYIYAFFSLQNKTSWFLGTLTSLMVFFVGSLSLDLEVGSMGLPNFGKVGFFAIGAYISTLLYSEWNWPFPLAVLAALAFSSFVGYFISIPTVKLRADYFAIMTIAGGEIIRLILQSEQRWLWVISPIGTPSQVISNDFKIEFTALFDQKITFFEQFGLGSFFSWEIILLIAFIIISLICYWFVQQIRKSPYGRTLRAIREDDITVTSVGKDVARFRWQVTTIAALLAGLAGVMYATTFGAFEAIEFRPALTFQLYMFIIIGGLGNSRGAFAGTALVMMFLQSAQAEIVKENIALTLGPSTPILGPLFDFLQMDVFVNPFNLRFVVLGIILILFLLFKPSGLIPEPRTDNEKYMKLLTTEERERSDEAVLARQSQTEKERITLEQKGEIA